MVVDFLFFFSSFSVVRLLRDGAVGICGKWCDANPGVERGRVAVGIETIDF